MKNKVIIILLGLILCIVLSSCGQQKDVYNVMIDVGSLNYENFNTSGYETFSTSGETYINSEVAKTKIINVLNIDYNLNYEYSVGSPIYGDNLNYYIDNEKNYQLAFSSSTGKLLRIMPKDNIGKIVSYNKVNIIETDYIAWLKDVIINIFAVDTTGYEYFCKTYMKDGSSEDIFSYVDAEQIDFYYFEYAKYIEGIKCADSIKIIAHPDGNIKSMVCSEFNVNNESTLNVNDEKLDRTIANTINSICASNYAIKNYWIKSKLLQFYNDNTILLCGVDVRTTDSFGEEQGCLIILAIVLQTD